MYRGVSDFKKGYQLRTNIVKDEKCDLFRDSHRILARWRNLFVLLLNENGVNDVRQAVHTAEPLVSEPNAFEIEMAIGKLKKHKSPGIDQIPAEFFKAGSRTIRYEIHKLIKSVWNKERLYEGWKELIIVPIYKKGDKTDCSNFRGISLLSATFKILSNILLSSLIPYAEDIIGDIRLQESL